MTSLTPLKSTPRLMTSVQIKHHTSPLANRATTSSRSAGDRSAWIASALMPSRTSSLASSLARVTDWTKMRTGGVKVPPEMRSRSDRSLWSSVLTNRSDWSIVDVAASLQSERARRESASRAVAEESARGSSARGRKGDALVPDDGAHHAASRSSHDALGELLDRARHGRAEHALAHLAVARDVAPLVARGEDLVRLLEKVELEQLVGLV